MITVDGCCCCFSLRTGSLIIGWWQLVVPILKMISSIVTQITGEIPAGQTEPTTVEEFWGSIFISVFQIILALCLLLGIYNHRKRLIYYYLLAEVILLIVFIIGVIIITVISGFASVGFAVAVAIGAFIGAAIVVYGLIVVYSYYEKM